MQQRNIILLLRFTTIALFFGRFWHCFRWNPPFSNLYYDVNGFGKVLEWYLGKDLGTIISNRLAEPGLIWLMKGTGIVFLIAGISAIFINRNRKWLKIPIYIGICFSLILYYGFFKAKHYNYGMLLEHSAQFMTPILLLWSIFKFNIKKIKLGLQLSISITFICHGLFAIGYYMVPGTFTDMLIKGLGVQQETSVWMLQIFAVLDFIFAVIIFFPKLANPVLIYGFIWGFATAFARIYTNFNTYDLENTFSQYFFEFFVRVSHFVFPLILLLIATNKINQFPLRLPKNSE